HDAKALAAEPLVAEERGAKMAEADEHHRPLAVEPEDLLELGLQPGHVVADAADAELPEVSEVLADLRRVQVESIGELLGGNGLHAVLLQLEETARIDRETTDRHLGNPREAIVRARRHRRREGDRKSTRLNSSHVSISYAVFCLK